MKLPCLTSTANSRDFTMKCFSRFLCLLLISLFMRTSGSFRLHGTESEEYADSLKITNKPSSPAGLGIDQRSRYEAPPAFFRDLYNFLQSVGENGVDFVAEPSQSISHVENDTYVSFLIYDEKFSSRQQFYLVFTQNQPGGANHPHGTTQNEDGERSEELVVKLADESNFTNDFGVRGKYVEQVGLHIDKYKVFNATEIVSYTRAGNGSQLVIKASMHLGNHSVDVTDFIVITPGNAKSPLLVAFDNPQLESYIRFLTHNREQPIERYEHPPNSHDDGLATPIKRPKRESNDYCRLHDWFISFNDIHWKELVYVPAGYNANFCHGSCHFGSLLRVLNATWPVSNHVSCRKNDCNDQSNHVDL